MATFSNKKRLEMGEANADDDDEDWWGAIRGWENNDHDDDGTNSLQSETRTPMVKAHVLPKLIVSSNPTKRAVGRLPIDAKPNNSTIHRFRKTAARIRNNRKGSVSVVAPSPQSDSTPKAANSPRSSNASPRPIAKHNNNNNGQETQRPLKERLLEKSLQRNQAPAIATLTTTPTTKTTSVAANSGGKSVPKSSPANVAPKANDGKPTRLHLALTKSNKLVRQKVILETRKLEPMLCKVVTLIKDKETWRPVPDPKQQHNRVDLDMHDRRLLPSLGGSRSVDSLGFPRGSHHHSLEQSKRTVSSPRICITEMSSCNNSNNKQDSDVVLSMRRRQSNQVDKRNL